jgi:hypothetical protein
MSADNVGEQRRADVVLDQTLAMLAPLVRLMLANGVTYPQLIAALKPAFLQAANAELAESRQRISDSAISIVSGVHRKDVRALSQKQHAPRLLSLAGEVIVRWTSDARYMAQDGSPRPLPQRGGNDHDQPSFDQLTQSVSRDLHSRAVLDELSRLGVLEVIDDLCHLRLERSIAGREFVAALSSASSDVHARLQAIEAHLRSLLVTSKTS